MSYSILEDWLHPLLFHPGVVGARGWVVCVGSVSYHRSDRHVLTHVNN